MISVKLILLLGLAHWVADFVLQTNWMAINKSKNTPEGYVALSMHCTIYGLSFLWMGLEFATITGVLHTITDFFTSRLTSKFWFITAGHSVSMLADGSGEAECESYLVIDWVKRSYFFWMLGLDQFIHLACLVGVTQLYINLHPWVDHLVWRFL